jgi:serine/threonine protein kinase
VLGALLGNYRVVKQLGEGGTGVIYVGQHETLSRSVVVKVLDPALSSKTDIVQRFFNEAQAAAAIRNPGIVQIFDFGTTPDGRAYIVMELLEGQSLAARLAQRRLDHVECCRIGRQVANVLQAAHAAGITHRDLKPGSVFLVPDPEVIGGERVKVLGFGTAKLTGEAHDSGIKTRTGLTLISPTYMSPEQCRSFRNADARSDVYSLGCILFEMTCGRPPFTGVGMGDILAAHLHMPPPHPQNLAPSMPHALSALIAKMLSKHPDARPQKMTAVAGALDDILRAIAPAPRASTPPPVAAAAPASPPVAAPAPAPSPASPPARAPTPLPVANPPPASPAARAPTPLPVPPASPAATTLPAVSLLQTEPNATINLDSSIDLHETLERVAAPPPAPDDKGDGDDDVADPDTVLSDPTMLEMRAPPRTPTPPPTFDANTTPYPRTPTPPPTFDANTTPYPHAPTSPPDPDTTTPFPRASSTPPASIAISPAAPAPPSGQPQAPAPLPGQPQAPADYAPGRPSAPEQLQAQAQAPAPLPGPAQAPADYAPGRPSAPGLMPLPAAFPAQPPLHGPTPSPLAAPSPPSGYAQSLPSEPAPMLRPMPQLSPEPPPYGIAATAPGSPPRGRLFLLGALAVVAVVVGIAIVAAVTSSDGPAPSTTPGTADAPLPADSAADSGESASLASQPAPPPASPEPLPTTNAAGTDTGSAAVPAATANAVDAECQKLQDERKWSELEQCADKLSPLDARRAAELRTRAVEEPKAAPRIAAFEAALRDGDLKRARAELDQVWPESVDYPKLQRDYDSAEAQAIAALAAELARAKDAGCQKYNALLAKALTAKPPRVAAEAARQTPCAPAAAPTAPSQPAPSPPLPPPPPPAKCDVDALADRGQNQYAAGQYAAALASYEAAYACKPSPNWSEKAFVLACNLKNLAKAKLHWKRLPPAMKNRAVMICVRNGITEAKLNTP